MKPRAKPQPAADFIESVSITPESRATPAKGAHPSYLHEFAHELAAPLAAAPV